MTVEKGRHETRRAFFSDALASEETAPKYLWLRLCTISAKRVGQTNTGESEPSGKY